MHSPRTRIRRRDPHPHRLSDGSAGGGGGDGGGRHHRRRSPPAPPSPRYQRRPQRRTPPPPPPPPRRGVDPHPDVSAPNQRRSILLEAGRLAAHYLVAQGVIPEHLLRAKEDPRPAQHPPATRGRKLDGGGGGGGGGDPRSRRNDGHCWARAWEDDDRPARKSTGWDRRTQSFDDRRKYHDAGHGVDVDRGARRSRDYDEPRRPPMSRSYSHNDRRPSASTDGGRVDPRSRSRSRSRSYYAGSSSSRDLLDHTKVHYRNVDEMPRQQRSVPSSSVVVAEVNVAIKDGETWLEMDRMTHNRDISEGEDGEFQQGICISEDEDGEFAAHRLNGEDGVEMDVTHTQHQLCDSHLKVHPPESVEEPVHRGGQLSNAVEDREMVGMDACTREAVGEDNDCSEASARDGMLAPHPQSEGEASVADFNRHTPELPASYRIFDLNVVQTPDACEMTEVSGDPQADHHVSDSVADLVGRVHQQTKCHASETQGQDGRAGGDHTLKNGHDLIRCDLNSAAVEDAHDIHLLENDKLLLSHGIDATRTQRGNGCLLLNQNADELEHENNWMENHTVIGEQLLLSDDMDGHPVPNHQMASQTKCSPMGVYDLHSYNQKSEEMLLNEGADKHAHDNCHLKHGQMLFNQPANRQARIHNRANERAIPVINLEDDDYEEQSDIREFLEAKSYQYLGPAIL